MASGRPTGSYYYKYYGINSNNACSSNSSTGIYSGDGISSYGSGGGVGGRYSRVPVTSTASSRSVLTANNYSNRTAGGSSSSSWSSPRVARYGLYTNIPSDQGYIGSRTREHPIESSLPAEPKLSSREGGAKSSIFLTRSDSGSSSGSARSTGTVCEDGDNQAETCTSPRERQLRSTEPPSRVVTPLDMPRSSEAAKTGLLDLGTSESSRPQVGVGVADTSTSKFHDDYQRPQKNLSSAKEEFGPLSPGPQKSGEVTESPGSDVVAAGPVVFGSGPEEDTQSVSTVSGSGIDFFRKFVQRKGSGCKECEDQFRREVLIDRLVADSLHSKAVLAAGSLARSSRSSASGFRSSMSRMTGAVSLSGSVLPALSSSSIASPCRDHHHHHHHHHQQDNEDVALEDTQSSSNRSSATSIASTISGSGLLFLKNYLSKKKQQKAGNLGRESTDIENRGAKNINFFNSTPMPFPPPRNHYGPVFIKETEDEDGSRCRSSGGDDSSSLTSQSSRRLSLCSTVADLLNEDFDCDDSELKNLDWEEWDEPLPEDFNYDDLVSVISESFYSDELDLAELCDLDLEGRKTVVASESELLHGDHEEERRCSGQICLSPDNDHSPNLGSTPVIQHEKFDIHNKERDEKGRGLVNTTTVSADNQGKSEPAFVTGEQGHHAERTKYGSYHTSSTFMQDIEAELELPPMSPVSDEKDEAVRAISRTISRYMRTRSDGSFSSETAGATSASASRQQQLPYSRTNSNSSVSGDCCRPASRRSTFIRTGKQSSRSSHNSKKEDYARGISRNSTCDQGNFGQWSACENYGRESRLSVSSSLSDYMPELAASPTSPAPYRRPLSQLLICDLPASSPGFTSPEQSSQLEDGKLQACSPWGDIGGGRSPGLVRSPPKTSLTQQQISEILTLPQSDCSISLDCLPGCSPQPAESLPFSSHLEIWPRARGDSFSSGKASQVKNANRDSLLCSSSGNCNFTPPQCGSPVLPSAAIASSSGALSFPLMRHSSCNSTDSGCPLVEDKNASPSPPPQYTLTASPQMTKIGMLSSNRTKLASFWEKTLNSSNNISGMPTADGSSSAWAGQAATNRGQQYALSGRHINYQQHNHGFQPPPARPGIFGSDTNLGSGGSSSERLAHFLDVTRRAAEMRIRSPADGGRNYLHHRASTGSECSDFVPRTGPKSPVQQPRRRDSYTDYIA